MCVCVDLELEEYVAGSKSKCSRGVNAMQERRTAVCVCEDARVFVCVFRKEG